MEQSLLRSPRAESHASTQPQLAALELPPLAVPELYVAADEAREEARPVPRAALAKFKFKLQPVKGFSLLWSNKGGGGKKEKLAVWVATEEGRELDL